MAFEARLFPMPGDIAAARDAAGSFLSVKRHQLS